MIDQVKFSRAWAMAAKDTFLIQPIRDFVKRYLRAVSVDPFSRNSSLATYTNDINPDTRADYHLDAVEFLSLMEKNGVSADVVLFDPPYSPRQISECYAAMGKDVSMIDTQNARLYSRCRRAIEKLCRPGSIVLSFGWNSCGMGKLWRTDEILLVCHGGAHNDTICMAQTMLAEQMSI